MYKQCKTEASSARQKELTQGLLNLMLEKHYQKISVADICRELGISRNSFYRYFSDKDAMLHALIDQMLLEFEVCVHYVDSSGHPLSTDQLIIQVFRYWKTQKPLLDALAFSRLTSILSERAMLPWLTRSTPLVGARIRDAEDQKYSNFFCVGGVLNMLIGWHHQNFDKSEEELTVLAHKLLTQPLFSGYGD